MPKHIERISTHFMTYITLAENDCERFVRASAVSVIHSALMVVLGELDETDCNEVKDNVRNMVIVSSPVLNNLNIMLLLVFYIY